MAPAMRSPPMTAPAPARTAAAVRGRDWSIARRGHPGATATCPRWRCPRHRCRPPASAARFPRAATGSDCRSRPRSAHISARPPARTPPMMRCGCHGAAPRSRPHAAVRVARAAGAVRSPPRYRPAAAPTSPGRQCAARSRCRSSDTETAAADAGNGIRPHPTARRYRAGTAHSHRHAASPAHRNALAPDIPAAPHRRRRRDRCRHD